MITASRWHDISAGHRVFGHESKCQHLHGHNYRVHFTVHAESLDDIGRVLDFGVIKTRLCQWLEDNWDHRCLIWRDDPLVRTLQELDPCGIVLLPVNPTAENMADYLLRVIGPEKLRGTGCVLTRVTIDETARCSATASLEGA